MSFFADYQSGGSCSDGDCNQSVGAINHLCARLQHELGDDAVEGGSGVAQLLALLALALLTSAQCAEVLCCSWGHLAVETHHDAA